MKTDVKTMFALKREARKILRPVYWSAFLVCLFSFLLYGYNQDAGILADVPITLTNAFQMFVLYDSPVLLLVAVFVPLFIFLANPLSVGRARYFLHGIDGDWKLSHLISPFRSLDYFRIVFVMGIRLLVISISFILSLLSIMFINERSVGIVVAVVSGIVGLIVYYFHRLTPYVLAENPKQGFRSATNANNRVTYSYSGRLFSIDLSFIAWYIVGAFFFGVGQFFFMPYHETTIALRYRELSLIRTEREGSSSEHLSKSETSAQRRNAPVVLGCIVLSISILFGLFPVTASAYAETEIIVTTEQELRDAIEQNLSPIRIDTTIMLEEGTIEIRGGQDITLKGTGTLVMARGEYHFSVFGGRLTLQENLTITASYGGFGGVLIGNIFSFGYFVMEGGRIERVNGSGVDITAGIFELRDGVIRENGTGVFLTPTRDNDALFLMTGGEISGHSSSGVGALVGGHISIRGGRITGNGIDSNWVGGGGVNASAFTQFSMDGGEISNNHADGFGGGVGAIGWHVGYENISIGPSARFFGNTAFGLDRSGNSRPHGSCGLHAGLEQYPQIRWSGENSRSGTHLINNYDIAFRGGMRRLAVWQIHFGMVGIILIGKGIALVVSLQQEKKMKLREESALCDVTK